MSDPLERARKILEQRQTKSNPNASTPSSPQSAPLQSQYDPELTARVDRLLRAVEEAGRRKDGDAECRIMAQITALMPDHVEMWLARGVALRQNGRAEEALECYERLLELDSNHVIGWRSKGVAYANLGRLSEAKLCYERALTLDPSDHGTWNSIGVLHVRLGDPQEAKRCYEKALALNPTNTWTMRNLAICHVRLEDIESALALLNRILSIEPDNAEAKMFLRQLQ